MLVSRELDIAEGIRSLGFEVLELDPETPYPLSEHLQAWLWPTHSDDTLLVLQGEGETCINLNDALHSAPRDVQSKHLDRLNQLFPDPDYVFCGYGIASHFPNCYRIPGKDDAATAVQRQSHFNAQWAFIMHELKPKYGFPFAANVVFFEQDLADLNEPTHNGERPTQAYRSLYGDPPGRLIDPAPGFRIEDGAVLSDQQAGLLDYPKLAAENPQSVARANSYHSPSDEQIEAIKALLKQNIDLCKPYLTEYRGNYLFEILLRGTDHGFSVSKQGNDIAVQQFTASDLSRQPYDVRFTTRAVYLRRSLAEPYGREVLFVGSGGIFDYRSKELADQNLHRELMVVLQHHHACPHSRYGDNSPLLYQLKTTAKRLLGRTPSRLYDLKQWTVYES